MENPSSRGRWFIKRIQFWEHDLAKGLMQRLNGAGKNTPWIKNLTFLLYQLGAKWAYESVFFIIAGDSHFNESWEFGSQWLWPASASACEPQHHLARAQLTVSCPDSLTSRRLTQPNATSHQARLRPAIIFTHTLPQPLLLTIPGNESYLIVYLCFCSVQRVERIKCYHYTHCLHREIISICSINLKHSYSCTFLWQELISVMLTCL